MKHTLLLIISILFIGIASNAQTTYQEKAQAYIDKYKDWAMMEQIRSGIPASITLAQGILETAAGESELSNNANNHFGIKCKSSWNGPTYSYTDDAKDECFRKYQSAYESYKDHSDFLKNNARYSSLFLYSPIDYKAWAFGLKKCGYATNPQYAVKLIKFIEDFGLEKFTVLAMNKTNVGHFRNIAEKEEGSKVEILDAGFENMGYASINDSSTIESKKYYIPETKNDLDGFYAKKGDLLLEYALEHKIRYSKLLVWNDLEDQPLTEDMFVYTESKRKKGLNAIHTFKSGETLHSVAQEEGIQLSQLLFYNHLTLGNQPKEGSILTLQALNETSVPLNKYRISPKSATFSVKKTNENADDYIVIKQKEAAKEEDENEVGKATKENEASIEEKVVERKNTPKIVEANTESKEYKTLDAKPELEIYSKKDGKEIEVDYPENDEITAKDIENKIVMPQQKEQKKSIVKKEKKDEKDMTPLDKLKVYMDQTVYGNEEPEQVKQETKEKETPKLTPTEKLKSYMDKTVKENQESEDIEQATKKQNGSKTTPTLPAAKQIAEPQPATRVQNNKAIYHIVKRGDTAFSIAKKYGISLSQLKELNHLPSSLVVNIGEKLRVK